ncbi:P80 family lipoprotein [Mycoplasmopsis ciconiae]|uniref:P80 family lipoprotein n=1 Tax=Mycoplasmopsis ciconiae TaxID=561067 RepID=A0ABU7MKE4_9BACT|nr:P80 family lipoprotein [Mycoplasmopsis ciconiae]
MFSKKKIKQFAISAAILSSATALLAAVSCGSGPSSSSSGSGSSSGSDQKGRFTVPESNEIKFGTTWSQTGFQYRAFEKIIAQYNKVGAQKYPNIFKPVALYNIGSGYSEGVTKVSQFLDTKKEGYHIYFGYPVIASLLAKSDMLLDFNGGNSKVSLKREQFDSQFLKSNSETQFVSEGSNTLYILPMAKSTQVLSFNSPVTLYAFETLLSKGAKLKEGDEKIKQFYETIKSKGQNDLETVKKIWGEPVVKDNEFDGYIIGYDSINTYSGIFTLAEKIQSLFKNAKDNPLNGDLHAMGIDDVTGVFETAVSQMADGNIDQTLIVPTQNDESTDIDYTKITNRSSATFTNAQQVYNLISNTTKSGALVLQPGGAYSSANQLNHKFAFSIGSTAGYSHNFTKNGVNALTITNNQFLGAEVPQSIINDLTVDLNSIKLNEAFYYSIEGNEVPGTKGKSAGSNAIIGLGNYANAVFPSNYTKADKYDLVLSSDEQKTMIEQFVNENKGDSTANKFNSDRSLKYGLLVFAKDKVIPQEFVERVKTASSSKSDLKFLGTLKDSKGLVFLVKNDSFSESTTLDQIESYVKETFGFTKVTKDTTNTLQENELYTLPTPSKTYTSNQKNVFYLQGPSFIGARSNRIDENATRAFMHWMMTDQDTYEFDKGKPMKILDFYQKSLSYVVGANISQLVASKVAGNNEYLTTAIQMFKDVVEKDDYILYETPSGINSDNYRKEIESAFNNVQTAVKDNKDVPNIIDNLVQKLQESAWFKK